jgi:glycosyltransferase involved in cell wall biosynthesis
MSPRVTYWTGTWDPAKEAISKEVSALRTGSRETAPVVSFSPVQRIAWRRQDRVLVLPGGLWPALRAVAAILEPRGDITHIFGGDFSWHLFRALGRRPILLTAVAALNGNVPTPRRDLARVAVETDSGVDEWLGLGFPRERVVVIRPGIDVDWYTRVPAPSGERFTLLFASTPSDPAEIEPRGIPLLVELARARPDCDFLVPWRQWGDLDAARRAIDELRPPPNFVVEHGDIEDMRPCYARSHATVVAFTPGVGKTCPNFVLEGFASGRPCLATSDAAFTPLVDRAGAGAVVSRDVASLSAGIDRLKTGWTGFADRARGLAEAEFSLRRFLSQYEQLYADILEEQTARRRA